MNNKIIVENRNIIRDPESKKTRITFEVTGEKIPTELWFEVDSEQEQYISDSWDATLVGLLAPAMASGASLHINGPLTDELFTQISENAIKIFSILSGYSPIKIDCNSLIEISSWNKTGINVTGFSGGVDSYCVLEQYYYNPIKGAKKVSHLVFNNVGANGNSTEQALYQSRLKNAKIAADNIGLPLISINSNLDDFYQPFSDLHFAKTHSLRNSTVGHLLSKGIDNYYYASGYSYKNIHVSKSEDIAFTDPILLPLLSTKTLKIHPTHAALNRIEKLEIISNLEVAKNNLHVCVDHNSEKNCSKCQKCIRTMIGLEVIGKIEEFSGSFDLNYFKKNKKRILYKTLTSTSDLNIDIQEKISQLGYPIPSTIQTAVKVYNAFQPLRMAFKSSKRLIKMLLKP